MLKSHIAKIERVRGGFNMEMLEFELDYRWNIFKDDPQFAFRFQMRLSDAQNLADAIYEKLRLPPKKKEKEKSRSAADDAYFSKCGNQQKSNAARITTAEHWSAACPSGRTSASANSTTKRTRGGDTKIAACCKS